VSAKPAPGLKPAGVAKPAPVAKPAGAAKPAAPSKSGASAKPSLAPAKPAPRTVAAKAPTTAPAKK
jgi:hypothetical protein